MFRKTVAICISAFYVVACSLSSALAASSWEAVDKRVAANVYQINVAIEIRFKSGEFAQLADLSSRRHYPVFITTKQNQGYRVIGHGTCFPVSTVKQDRTYLLTNKHVIDFGEGMVQECERFFAGMRMYAERSAGFANPDQRYQDLQRIVNFATKKNASDSERMMYQATVDTIWDTYDDKLSLRADPERKEFTRCLAKVGLQSAVGYFVHFPGNMTQPPVVAQLYKQARGKNDTDLAVLAVNKRLGGLEIEATQPKPGESIQAVGYPASSAPGAAVAGAYTPSFATGKVTRVQNALIHFDANVSKGDSGGPLINASGRVLGVVARRATPDERYAGAISMLAVKAFAPELFGAPPRAGSAH